MVKHTPFTKPQKLVLFDIDGTLLDAGSQWKECFLQAIQGFYPNIKIPQVSFGGKTDPQIYFEILSYNNISMDESKKSVKAFSKVYSDTLMKKFLENKLTVQLLKGAQEVVHQLSMESRVLLGLLTGNIKKMAYVKLQCVRLDHYFNHGVFGDDHHDRYQLPSLAVERVFASTGHSFKGKEIVIIGDTVHDINCGKSLGVKTIAVGTGRVKMEELLSHSPDHYFDNMGNVRKFVQAVLEE